MGHGAIAADGIDRFLSNQEMQRRPKIDVHSFDLMRKYVEKGIQMGTVKGALHGTDQSKAVVHNYEDRSERYVIPHDQLFLGHFQYTDRNKRHVTHLNKDSALGNFEERIDALSEAQAIAEAKRCMSCGQCFECDNCVVYCPQTAVYKVKKTETMTGRYVATDYDKCIGCHICADVCPDVYKRQEANDHRIVTFHDSCNVARGSRMGDYAGGQFDIPRNIIRAVANHYVDMSEATTREKTFCCGGGGGLLTDELLDLRVKGALPRMEALNRIVQDNGVNFMATICAICKAQFTKVLPYYGCLLYTSRCV